jgi:predicted nucleotidyltransferase
MPKVAEVSFSIKKIAKQICSDCKINKIYVWGSYAKNKNKPDFPLRDLDIITETNLEYEDLLAISDIPQLPFNLKKAQIEKEGLNSDAINFTKSFLKISYFNMDHWAFSNNGNLLHWGPILEDAKDWNETNKEIEKKILKETGLLRKDLVKAGTNKKNNWKTLYDYYFDKILSGVPNGWYLSCQNKNDISNDIVEI